MNIKLMANKALFTLKKHSPEILLGVGVVGMIGGTVLACVQTHKKLPEALEKKDQRLEAAKQSGDNPAKAYICTAGDMAVIYGPSAALMLLSTASIFASNAIVRRRLISLAAAYATLDQSFKLYRGRVAERYGGEAEHEIRNNIKIETRQTEITDENGEVHTIEEEVRVAEGMPSDYARYFCRGEADAAEHNLDYNHAYVKQAQDIANRNLRIWGYMFLSDVYDALGIPRTLASQTVGWIYDPDDDTDGDNYIDFGIQQVMREDPDDPTKLEEVLLLDFNVDGPIMDRCIEKGLIKRK